MGVFLLATIWSAYKYKAPPVTAQDKNLEPPTPPLYQIYTLMVLTLFFLLVSLHNPRGIEFLVPFTAILISRISPLIQN